MTELNLNAYFAHIGYAGAAEPSLATLRELLWRHPQRIAFENLSPLLGEPVPLDLASLQAKLLGGGRGGWCFEHNLLLRAVLRQLGFEVTGLAARVPGGESPQAAPRSHMLLSVRLPEGVFIADAGFGGQTPTAPLRLQGEVEQPTPHGTFRLNPTADGYGLALRLPQGWSELYHFDLQPQQPADYEYANWYLATHPSSIFRAGLRVARPAPDGRHTLLNGRYQLHGNDGVSRARTLGSVAELREVLREHFGLVAPPGEAVDARLASLLQN